MIITEIVSVFFIEIGQVCMLSRTLILELGRGCLFSSITSEKQWLRSKKGKGFRLHAAHPPPPPAPLNFPGSLPGKPTWILIMGEGEIKLLASAGVSLLRSFSNNDRDDNGKVKKKSNRFIKQNNNYHTFLFISLPSLQDCYVKMSNFTFYGKCTQVTMNFSFPF